MENGMDEVQKLWSGAFNNGDQNDRAFLKIEHPSLSEFDYFNSIYKFFINFGKTLVISHLNF